MLHLQEIDHLDTLIYLLLFSYSHDMNDLSF